jgi:hypothetical protein
MLLALKPDYFLQINWIDYQMRTEAELKSILSVHL